MKVVITVLYKAMRYFLKPDTDEKLADAVLVALEKPLLLENCTAEIVKPPVPPDTVLKS